MKGFKLLAINNNNLLSWSHNHLKTIGIQPVLYMPYQYVFPLYPHTNTPLMIFGTIKAIKNYFLALNITDKLPECLYHCDYKPFTGNTIIYDNDEDIPDYTIYASEVMITEKVTEKEWR